jgi:3-hydroxyacyl-CoA dehydrogenase
VIGAGVMGCGIAQLLAHKGLRVHVRDIRDDLVAKARLITLAETQRCIARLRLCLVCLSVLSFLTYIYCF